MSNPHKVVVFDVETTGIDPVAHTIQHIGAVATTWPRFDEALDAFQVKVLVDESRADPKALEMSAYDQEEWERCGKSPLEAANMFTDWLSKHATTQLVSRKGRPFKVTRLCAHNARFDLDHTLSWYRKIEERFRVRLFFSGYFVPLDTLQRAIWMAPWESDEAPSGPHSVTLGACCQRYGVETIDALDDVLCAHFTPWDREYVEGKIHAREDPHHALVDAGKSRVLAQRLQEIS